MGTLRLVAGDVSAQVNAAAGGRVASFRVGSLELLGRVGPQPWEWGSFVMAPYAGRVRDGVLAWEGKRHPLPVNDAPHAMHGLVLDRPWTVTGTAGHAVSLRCDLDERWPWPGHVEQTIEVRPDGLDQRVEVHCRRGAMPAWCGWHPWFPAVLGHGPPVEIGLTAAGMHQRDDAGIATREIVPVPAGPWDDAFTGVSWPVTLTWPGALRLAVTADTEQAVVFNRKPHVVCVEPQTAPPDAVALDDYTLVTPGRPLTARMSWTVHREGAGPGRPPGR